MIFEIFDDIYHSNIRLCYCAVICLGVMIKGSHASHVHDVALDLPMDPSTSHDHSHHHHDNDKVKMGGGISSWIR